MPEDLLETRTFEYLESLWQANVKRWPEGENSFPDFSLGCSIAVESTRLVRKVSGSDAALETQHPSTIQTLENAISRVQLPSDHCTRYVNLYIDYPIDARNAARQLYKFLNEFGSDPKAECRRHRVCDNLHCDVRLSREWKGRSFRLAIISSPYFAGWTVDQLVVQCMEAIARKESRIAKVAEKYSEFWLAVGSQLTLSLDDAVFEQFKEAINVQTKFDRLILVDANSPEISRQIEL